MPDEEFLVPREKILRPPSKAAIWDAEPSMPAFRASKAILADAPPNGWPPLYSMAAHIDAAMAEEREAAERIKAYLLRMGTRCGRCPPGQRHEDCGDCERREIVAAYEKARGKEAGNG